jgi:hypothetical protein
LSKVAGHLTGYRDEGRPLRENAGMIYLSLRHPLAVLASLERLGWKWGNCDYLRDQLKVMLHLLKYGGVIAFDDYEWNRGDDPLGRPRAGIDAFSSVFRPELRLVKSGYRRIWQKVVRD